MRNVINMLVVVVVLASLFAGCNKFSSVSGPQFTDQEIIAIATAFCENAISDKEHFNWYKIPNPSIVIIEKGKINDNKELPVKISISGEAYGSVGDRGVLKNPDFLNFAFKNQFKDEIRVFYVCKNDFGKIRLWDDRHQSYIEQQ